MMCTHMQACSRASVSELVSCSANGKRCTTKEERPESQVLRAQCAEDADSALRAERAADAAEAALADAEARTVAAQQARRAARERQEKVRQELTTAQVSK